MQHSPSASLSPNWAAAAARLATWGAAHHTPHRRWPASNPDNALPRRALRSARIRRVVRQLLRDARSPLARSCWPSTALFPRAAPHLLPDVAAKQSTSYVEVRGVITLLRLLARRHCCSARAERPFSVPLTSARPSFSAVVAAPAEPAQHHRHGAGRAQSARRRPSRSTGAWRGPPSQARPLRSTPVEQKVADLA